MRSSSIECSIIHNHSHTHTANLQSVCFWGCEATVKLSRPENCIAWHKFIVVFERHVHRARDRWTLNYRTCRSCLWAFGERGVVKRQKWDSLNQIVIIMWEFFVGKPKFPTKSGDPARTEEGWRKQLISWRKRSTQNCKPSSLLKDKQSPRSRIKRFYRWKEYKTL